MDQHLINYKRCRRLFLVVALPLVVFYVALALPIFGTFVFEWLVHDTISACGRTIEGLPIGPCYLNGWDLADILGAYYGSAFFAGLLNPLIAFDAVRALIPGPALLAWAGASLASGFLALLMRRKARRPNGTRAE
jgi:hypothetical protein